MSAPLTHTVQDQVATGPQARRHLLIAGSGRAGTSFLVRYLTAAGLDTHLARRGEDAWFDDDAHAGLEDMPVAKLEAALPYVIKSPWSYEMIDEVLADPLVRLDAVIIPVRDLMEAAASRVILEQRAVHARSEWMASLDRSWRHVGLVPGGVVYSLEPLDQARILATGFHHLLDRLLRADVPVRLLSFPRLVEDPDYLFEHLRDLLPATLDAAKARDVHAHVADPAKVRVGAELRWIETGESRAPANGAPSVDQLDRIALARELRRVRRLHAAAEAARRAADECARQAKLEAEEGRAATRREAQLRQQVADLERVSAEHLAALKATRASTSWRLTAPLRTIVMAVLAVGRRWRIREGVLHDA